jgi:hypothetical protein
MVVELPLTAYNVFNCDYGKVINYEFNLDEERAGRSCYPIIESNIVLWCEEHHMDCTVSGPSFKLFDALPPTIPFEFDFENNQNAVLFKLRWC